VRSAGAGLVQVLELWKPGQEGLDDGACVVGGSIVDDRHTNIDAFRPFSGQQALERTRQQRGPIVGGNDHVQSHVVHRNNAQA
jgi:hypothetical protein